LPTNYLISVTNFIGTIDLLLYLVHQRELDIAHISLSDITSNYIEWWRGKYVICDKEENNSNEIHYWNGTGEFILSVALLLEFKASSLLPDITTELEVFEPEQWKEQSAELLLAYQNRIDLLDQLEVEQSGWFDRGYIDITGLETEIRSDLLLKVSMYDLTKAFQNITLKMDLNTDRNIDKVLYTIEGQKAFILAFFKDSNRISFDKIASALHNRIAVVTTFLAILELIKHHTVIVQQEKNFSPLSIILIEH
jgi:segregation and condensation protein A